MQKAATIFLASACCGHAALTIPTIGINFIDGIVPSSLAPTDVAGATPQANWNNATASGSGTLTNLVSDLGGVATTTGVSVTWSGSPYTWSSTGQGGENNGFSGANRSLMTGYLDTNNTSTTVITVTGISEEQAILGYEVIVYALGDVAGRSGSYSIGSATRILTSMTNPSSHLLDPGLSVSDVGTYTTFMVFGTSFTLTATGIEDAGGTARAPVNAIQICFCVPEPTTVAYSALVGLLLLRRRR